ncbi:hypothetical protein ING2E5B_1716 [Fermentimonas caenicola]|jgi:hypothetical protein|uniref:Uncharacterized protein n=1 Tax=Fermentimonas caenicola TaxID=1562970 RepID=A0A098C3H5_9BACT|nr:hypothetical protein ING2E5B_1716 [Fermentimonas caenicola]
MLLVESLKIYAGTHRTSKAIYSYLETEDMVAKFDAYIQVEDITEEWIMRFKEYAGSKHVGNIKRVIKHTCICK